MPLHTPFAMVDLNGLATPWQKGNHRGNYTEWKRRLLPSEITRSLTMMCVAVDPKPLC